MYFLALLDQAYTDHQIAASVVFFPVICSFRNLQLEHEKCFSTTDESCFMQQKSVILRVIIHDHASAFIEPRPPLVIKRLAYSSARQLFYTKVKCWLWTIFTLIVAVTKEY